MTYEVRVAEVSETDKVLNTLMLAFATDPPVRWLMSTPDDYLAGFKGFAGGMGGPGMAAGTGYLAEDGAAAALWLPPGVASDSMAMAVAITPFMTEAKGAVAGQVSEGLAHYHPHEPHWYLAMIGVDPARQGLGLGSALLKAALQRCDADGVIAYLESSHPKNVPLYQRFGFEVMGVVQPGDFPPIYPMLRPARG